MLLNSSKLRFLPLWLWNLIFCADRFCYLYLFNKILRFSYFKNDCLERITSAEFKLPGLNEVLSKERPVPLNIQDYCFCDLSNASTRPFSISDSSEFVDNAKEEETHRDHLGKVNLPTEEKPKVVSTSVFLKISNIFLAKRTLNSFWDSWIWQLKRLRWWRYVPSVLTIIWLFVDSCLLDKIDLITQKKVVKKYPCPFKGCGRVFTKESVRDKHVGYHYKSRPFKCHICSKSYTQNGNLKKHMRVHKNPDIKNRRRHIWEFCGKGYTEKYNLKVRLHSAGNLVLGSFNKISC